jgi:hypothetical protein
MDSVGGAAHVTLAWEILLLQVGDARVGSLMRGSDH